jgi:hypothetical protein
MEIISNIRLVSNSYQVELDLADAGLTPSELEAIQSFGEPVISIGGDFDDGDDLTFSLADEDRKFPSQFPAKAVFNLSDYPSDANARAVLFRNTIRERLETAIVTLRAKVIGVTGREISNIDTTP